MIEIQNLNNMINRLVYRHNRLQYTSENKVDKWWKGTRAQKQRVKSLQNILNPNVMFQFYFFIFLFFRFFFFLKKIVRHSVVDCCCCWFRGYEEEKRTENSLVFKSSMFLSAYNLLNLWMNWSVFSYFGNSHALPNNCILLLADSKLTCHWVYFTKENNTNHSGRELWATDTGWNDNYWFFWIDFEYRMITDNKDVYDVIRKHTGHWTHQEPRITSSKSTQFYMSNSSAYS